jgi:hypothetical protein
VSAVGSTHLIVGGFVKDVKLRPDGALRGKRRITSWEVRGDGCGKPRSPR